MSFRLLDLFCGAGGAGEGYRRAGFEVTGIDSVFQPRYPFRFAQADALTWPLAGYDAVHASPPCREHSSLAKPLAAVTPWGHGGTGWMLPAIRERLRAAGVPYVIENVESARMPGSVVLCGAAFGLTVVDQEGTQRWLKRHRRFESNVPLTDAGGCHCRGKVIGGVYGSGGGGPRSQACSDPGWGRRGGYQLAADRARAILDVPWMNRDEAAQAIPPAYTEHIGTLLLAALRRAA